nr:hypothetical protein [Tanacetum cinerariifolium]
DNSEYFLSLVTPSTSTVGQIKGPCSTDSRIILPFGRLSMYSSILLFHESYMSFSDIGGRLSAPDKIALSVRLAIEQCEVKNYGIDRAVVERLIVFVVDCLMKASTRDFTNFVTKPENKVKGSLDADEDVGVDEVNCVIDGAFVIGESNVETLGVDEDESNRVTLVLKDRDGEFDDSLDEINQVVSEEIVIRVLEGRDISGEVFSVTPWTAKGGRMVLCYVQGSERRERKKMLVALFLVPVLLLINEYGILESRFFLDNILRAMWFRRSGECYGQVTEGRATQEDKVQARMARGFVM